MLRRPSVAPSDGSQGRFASASGCADGAPLTAVGLREVISYRSISAQ